MSPETCQNDFYHKHPEEQLSLYKMMVDACLDSITLIDRNYKYKIVNEPYINARQLKKEEVLNHSVSDVWGKEIFEQIIKEKLDDCFNGKTVSHISAYEFQKDKIDYIETIYTPCINSGTEVSYAVVISHNITELKKSQEKIKTLAYYDSLTNLPNRPLFMDLLNHEIKSAKRNGKTMALFFLDLDEFKKVNDSFGHSTGDELLVSVGDRLKKYLRQNDTLGRLGGIIRLDHTKTPEKFARLGGDEFTLVIPNIPDKKFAAEVAEKILKLFNEPFHIKDREIFISTSIGIALYPDDGEKMETLLKNADSAMYSAKEVGKNTFKYYSSDMNKKAKERIELENKMRYAIKNDEFLLYFQPQYNIDTSQLVGTEALIRWKKNGMGMLPPSNFISLAEETGMIIQIGEWVIHAACHQVKIWHDRGFGKLKLCVNISTRQFFDPQFVEKIKSVIETARFNPSFLELEITETSMIHDTERAIKIINDLKEMGIKISLDDFGTGYSSLVHLKLFPIDTLKIDQLFIRKADFQGRDGAIISAIIEMCHNLQIKVVAEGVETKKSLNFLKKRNCHIAQGFFYNPPLTTEEFEELLEGNKGY